MGIKPCLGLIAALLGPIAANAAGELDSSKVVTQPTVATLNYTARMAGTLPLGGLDVHVRCSGATCISASGKLAPEVLSAASLRFSMTRYDTTGLKPNGPWDVVIHFDPKDVLPLTPPSAIPFQTQTTVIRGVYASSQGSKAALSNLFPDRALRMGKDGMAALACQVQIDLSMACVTTRESPAGFDFATAALRESLLLKAPPTLPDGSSLAGAWFSHTVEFMISP